MIDIRFCFRAFMNNAAVNTGAHSCVHVFSVLLSTFPGRNWGWDLILCVFKNTFPQQLPFLYFTSNGQECDTPQHQNAQQLFMFVAFSSSSVNVSDVVYGGTHL